MSANEESIKPGPPASPAKAASGTNLMGYVEAVLKFLSSVKFGVTLLVILVILSMIGMLIIQQNVDGFDSYYASLTPAERTVYGALGLFDIYHVWYYNLLLLVLSLNIVLASIERFPSAWSYIRNPKKTATADWLKQQQVSSEYVVSGTNTESVIDKLRGVFDRRGFTPEVTETTTRSYAVDESGKK
ncbi:MAG TPA: cytochrome c biogenesis protein ResB, partial [Pyrinomonadaceae bacterium]|nr:cytochrome c biogenesis protein ResB [Pyrinomonadaceae bacterium]